MSDGFVSWHFPHRADAKRSQRLACYVQCVSDSYYTGGWSQQAGDKVSAEEELPKKCFTSNIFSSSCPFSTFPPPLNPSSLSQHISPVDLGGVLIFLSLLGSLNNGIEVRLTELVQTQ